MRIFILSLVLGLFSLETMALSCDITNYRDYIWNGNLTNELIRRNRAGCVLTKADWEGAGLRQAKLWRANLQGANLKGADLGGADLEGADLRGADLQEAKLQGANLESVNAQEANFENAIYDSDTDFPGWDYMFKKEHNMIKMIEEK